MLSVKYISNYLNKNEYEQIGNNIDNNIYKKLQEFEKKKIVFFRFQKLVMKKVKKMKK